MDIPKNSIQFKLWGRYALFTDPITKMGGERCSYHIPTYEALKGVTKSIYWKPTLIWHIDKVRVMKPIRTQTKGTKPLKMSGGNDLAIYTYLVDVEYQVLAHFEWNMYRPELVNDRIDGKHFQIAQRTLLRGGRQDIFLGTRDCQGYVGPCQFGEGQGHYDNVDEVAYGLMFHSFGYPDETGDNILVTRFYRPVMKEGVIDFTRTDDETNVIKEVRTMQAKKFGESTNFQKVENEYKEIALQAGWEDGKL
ncbi:MAG TPA: type I-C CRISPR-associated protein Cas5c [Bacteroidales bacterium]|jgi:CRISPR-associated protein Cas5d|nr:type I-C CRISPR-associated protein Cas5c [Bacteroidales bacterium]HQO08452.1 type I-C CRISPR-associated protein Cas5c [Bacteroidales bacterium]